MKKRLLSLGLLVVVLLGATAFPACGEKKPPEPKPETVTVYGEFYTIKEAYEQGYVTRDDLDYIVKYEREKDKFDLLAESQKEKILHDYKATHLPVSDQLEINSYGSYHGCAAVLIRDRYYENWLQKTILPYKVGDKGYTSETLRRLRIWKESETPIEVEKPKKPYGAFYSLQKAYEHGFLTQKDLLQISEQTYFDDPSIEQIIKENIRNDYQILDMEKSEKIGVDCIGNFNGCIALRIFDGRYVDVLMDIYSYEVNGIIFSTTIPFINVWCPLSE